MKRNAEFSLISSGSGASFKTVFSPPGNRKDADKTPDTHPSRTFLAICLSVLPLTGLIQDPDVLRALATLRAQVGTARVLFEPPRGPGGRVHGPRFLSQEATAPPSEPQ